MPTVRAPHQKKVHFVDCLTLQKTALSTFETSLTIYQSTRPNAWHHLNLQQHSCWEPRMWQKVWMCGGQPPQCPPSCGVRRNDTLYNGRNRSYHDKRLTDGSVSRWEWISERWIIGPDCRFSQQFFWRFQFERTSWCWNYRSARRDIIEDITLEML